MVLGLRTKTKKSPTVQVDYLIHIQEIKPWPPSQSLRTIRSVIIQWEHGDRNSGCTNPVVPSVSSGSDIGDGKIEFNNSFRLPATLMREMPIKGGGGDTFQKNCIEFNLYEPRRDKTVKGQLLGTAIIDLADYGVIKETLMISATMNCKRSYRNTSQPVLFLQIQPTGKSRASSSSDNLLKEALTDKNGGESVSALMDEEYAEEAEIASFTDDDVSSHSSVAISSSALESNGGSSPVGENGLEAMKHSPGVAKVERVLALKQGLVESDEKPVAESNGSLKGSSFSSSSTDLPSDLAFITRKIRTHSTQPSSLSSSMVYEETEGESKTNARSSDHDDLTHSQEKVPNGGTEDEDTIQQDYSKIISNGPLGKLAFLNTTMNPNDANFCGSQTSGVDYEKTSPTIEGMPYAAGSDNNESSSSHNENEKKHQEKRQETDFNEDKGHSLEVEPLTGYSSDGTRMQKALGNDALFASRENSSSSDNILNMDRSKHVKSVRSLTDSTRGNGLVRHSNQFHKTRDVNYLGDAQNGFRSSVNNERKDKVYLKETRNTIADGQIHHLENRIKMLEGELREAAAIEVGLYSVIAEHGSSISKVHAPARRLSRLYLHSHKEYSQSRSASAAQSVISALVLVAKAGGNDVPRLTFWLSNSIVLRAIISQAFVDRQVTCSAGSSAKRIDDKKESCKKSSSLKWESCLSKDVRNSLPKSFDDWEDPCTFAAALEKIEAWIFSRIVESIWWQALTPHMQSASINEYQNSDSRKIGRSKSHSGDQEGAFSLELWKKAFKDACEKICPIRAGGHECGCLPMLSRLIMEQCVARLDVAMFNAILRDSADEIPTDPMSDPISDVKVLPIPAGKASFGAGAQLKNAIGSWSRWLTDLCGIDDDDTFESEDRPNNTDYERKACDTSFKPFHLLHALSDLMMLPKDMLLSGSIRKEVCPAFGPSLIRRVLANFAPDEFCPDPIPDVVLEALNSEDPEAEDDSGMNFPCTATQIVYLPPSAALVVGILEDTAYDQSRLRRSGSSVLKKSNTSDDELDELDSPLKSIIIDNFRASSSPTNPSWSQSAVRYQLLREVWLKSE